MNGLRNKLTRFAIFKELRHLKADICFLQETFITDSIAHEFHMMWKGKVIYVPGTPNSLGDIILIGEKFDYDNLEIVHKEQRIIIMKFKHECAWV